MGRYATGQVLCQERKRGKVFALRYSVKGYGRVYELLGAASEGWTQGKAEQELRDRLALVRMELWRPRERAPQADEPRKRATLHEFASDWFERRRFEVSKRTSDHWRWALSCHLLEPLGALDVGSIRKQAVDAFKTAKLAERRRYEEATEEERKTLGRPLSNGSINKCLKVLAMILDDAIEDDDGLHPGPNPVRGRLLEEGKPKRTWVEADQAAALIDAAGDHRALIATMVFAGLRVSELTNLRWRSVDLAGGKLTVEQSKTEAGEGRRVDLSPMLLDELKLHRADAEFSGPDDFVFATRNGTRRERSNITRQILRPAVKAANAARAKAGLSQLVGITNHSLRRTFASLLYEAGANPVYVKAQMGHRSSALALDIYAHKMEVQRDTGARMDAIVFGPDWHAVPASGAEAEVVA
jgi:integrase